MDPSEEEEELVPAKRISGDRRPEGEDEDRSIRTLARSREKEIFRQRAECGQSTQIITVAECRSDLFGISLFIITCNRRARLLRKREKFGEDAAAATTRVQQMFFSSASDKFPCSSTKTNRNLSVAAFLETNPGSLGHLAVGEVRRCRGGDWHPPPRPPAQFPPLGKSLEQSVGLRWWPAVWRDPAGGWWYSPPRSALSRPGDHN